MLLVPSLLIVLRLQLSLSALYHENDRIDVADSKNFSKHIAKGDGRSLVQFYNSFCADCRRYAKDFKKLAKDLYKWRSALNIVAVDCSDEINVRVCRSYDVREVPTLRYLEKNGHYAVINTKNITLVREYLAEKVSNQLVEPIENVAQIKKPEKTTIVVYQPPKSFIGRDTVLHMLDWKAIADTTYITDYQIAYDLGYTKYGDKMKLAVIFTNGTLKRLNPFGRDCKSYVKFAGEYMRKIGYTPDPTRPTIKYTTPKPHASSEEAQRQKIIAQVQADDPKVYRADLEQAIDMILHIEVPRANLLKGANLNGLKGILNLIEAFNPLNEAGRNLVHKLNLFVRAKDSLTGEAYEKELKRLEKLERPIFMAKRYIGCIPSRADKRGYSCTLWILFHYLTVMSGKEDRYSPTRAVLLAMHGYITNFFGCTHCVEHFTKMCKDRNVQNAVTKDEQILWLWEAHNFVNNRLSGDPTEDPIFKKIQFPRPAACRECRQGNRNTTWKKENILHFLKTIYDIKALSFFGLPNISGYN